MQNRPPSVFAATSAAMARMKLILFQPFDAGKWFVLGFSAWLATMFDGGGSSGGGGGDDFGSSGSSSEGESGSEFPEFTWKEVRQTVAEWIATARQWISENPEITIAIGVGIALVVLILIILFWVRCRGKFMFLDNVVWDRALVVHPWKVYRRQGNSLFWWSTFYGIFVMVLLLGALGGIAYYVISVFENRGAWDPNATVTVVLMGGGFFVLWLILAYISMALEDFVTPLMYRDYLTTTQAWGKFLSLNFRHPFRFLGYAIWRLILVVGIGVALIVIGLATCCIGLILMAIPYIGAVVLLPVTVFVRSLGPEYLAQFGEEYDLFDLEER